MLRGRGDFRVATPCESIIVMLSPTSASALDEPEFIVPQTRGKATRGVTSRPEHGIAAAQPSLERKRAARRRLICSGSASPRMYTR
jgi:hypothetical protein